MSRHSGKPSSSAGLPTPEQLALLDFLLSTPFDGRDELLKYRLRLRFRSYCDCGCPSFSAHVDGVECSGRDWKLPSDASTLDPTGANPIDVSLFRCEKGVHVEVVDHLDRPSIRLPAPSELTLLNEDRATDRMLPP
jgi:hypothetical protein